MAKITERMQEVARLRDEEKLSYAEIGEKLGIKEKSAKNLHMRTRKATRMAESGLGSLAWPEQGASPEKLAEMSEIRAERILQSIDDVSIASATLYQRVMAYSALIDKSRLLRGEATAIVSVEDKRKINQLIPLLMQEVERRGIIIEGECEVT